MDNRYFLIGIITLIILCVLCGLIIVINKSYNNLVLARGVLNYNTGLYIKQSLLDDAGRGVFTSKTIEENQIVEICPLINVNKKKIENTLLDDYAFGYSNKENKDKIENNNDSVIVFGYGSLYNHSSNPNCSHTIDNIDNKMIIVSKRRIEKDEELYINYGENWFSSRNL